MPLVGEPGSPYLDIGDAEDDVVKFFKDLEVLFRRNAVIDEELKPTGIPSVCNIALLIQRWAPSGPLRQS